MNKVLAIILVILVLGLAYFAWTTSNSNQPNNNVVINPPVPPQEDILPEQNTDQIKTYTSSKLNVQFNYFVTDGDPIIEEGNIIYVGGKKGQFVEEYAKAPADTLGMAIKKKFLVGIEDKDCPIVPNPTFSSATTEAAEIAVGFTSTGLDDPRFATSPCPIAYRQTNGIRYFWMDKTHPDKFFFFSIGQYAILAEKNENGEVKTWQETFQVLK